MSTTRALVIDQHNVYALSLTRLLARQGASVDVFAEAAAPASRSRFCARALVSPPWYAGAAFVDAVQRVVAEGGYDAIYLCGSSIVQTVLPLVSTSPAWRALPVGDGRGMRIALSKNETLPLVTAAGVAVPRTMVPGDEAAALAAARELQYPVVVKGEKGESARNVEIVQDPAGLVAAWRRITGRERAYGGRTMVQEFISGPGYLMGGLFLEGRPLRLVGHRKLLTVPAFGGVTVKGITERPPALVEATRRVFEALRYTGLGCVEFVRDARDGRFQYMEVNPRVWSSLGVVEHAGVDVHGAYVRLAHGLPVAPDLGYREGVVYRHLTAGLRLVRQAPRHAPGILGALLVPRTRWIDFDWTDLAPLLSLRPSGASAGSQPPLEPVPAPPPAAR